MLKHIFLEKTIQRKINIKISIVKQNGSGWQMFRINFIPVEASCLALNLYLKKNSGCFTSDIFLIFLVKSCKFLPIILPIDYTVQLVS